MGPGPCREPDDRGQRVGYLQWVLGWANGKVLVFLQLATVSCGFVCNPVIISTVQSVPGVQRCGSLDQTTVGHSDIFTPG